MASPDFSINGGPVGEKASVATGGAVTAVLDSTVGVRSTVWSVIRTDDLSTPAAYTLTISGAVQQQCDTTALTAGTSAALQAIINGGIDPSTDQPSAEMTTVAKFFVPTPSGLEVLNAGELGDDNRESSAVFGAVEPINESIRAEALKDDVVVGAISTTPFTISDAFTDLYLVNTIAIGGPSSVTMPDDARIGQTYEIRDNQLGAFSSPITVNLPLIGGTFEDGTTSRIIYADGGAVRVVKTAAVEWRILKETSSEDYITILAGDGSTQLVGFDRVAAVAFDTARYLPGAKFIFEAVLETSNAADTAEVTLFNVTDVATELTLSTASTTPTTVAAQVVLPAGPKIYELQIRLQTTGAPNTATVGSAGFRAIHNSSG